METRYYYIRLAAYDDKAEKEGIATWHLCSKARAEKRQKAAFGTESFSNFVVSLTETAETKPKEGFVTIRELELENRDFESAISVTLNKEWLFGGEDKEYRAQIALDIFEHAADCRLAWALRQ